MTSYYDTRLSANRLAQCYAIAPPRVQQYLDAEMNFVMQNISDSVHVLDLGCGYGRTLTQLAAKASTVVGIDVSIPSLSLGHATIAENDKIALAAMDAAHIGFRDESFDAVVCIQNGISAFHVDRLALVSESIRVVRRGGVALFSSYAAKFWDDRMQWFRLQSQAGLLGEIDEERSREGVIVCKDGFTAYTVDEAEFMHLADSLGVEAACTEVDGSSLFCVMRKT